MVDEMIKWESAATARNCRTVDQKLYLLLKGLHYSAFARIWQAYLLYFVIEPYHE